MIRSSAPAMAGLKALLLGIIALGAVMLIAFLTISGSKTGLALALAVTFGPAALYVAIKRPLVFPFALYVFLVPFDNLLTIAHFGTLTKLLAILSGAALVYWLLRTRTYVKPSATLILWTLYVVWAAASVGWAISPEQSVVRIASLAELFLLYAALSLVPLKNRDLVIVLIAACVGGAAASLYGAYLFHSGAGLLAHSKEAVERVYLTSGKQFIDPNHFGAALILPVGLVIMSVLRTHWSFWKVAMIALLCILMTGVYFSGSRGAIVAIGVMMAYFFLRSPYRWQLFGVGTLLAVSSLADPKVWLRFQQISQTGGAGRLPIWRVGFEAFKQHWLTGAGIDNFPLAYNRVLLQSKFVPGFDRGLRFSDPHSLLMQTSVELGIVGLILVFAAWLSQFKLLSHVRPYDPLYDLRIALEGTVLALLVAAMFLDIVYYKYAWLAFEIIALTRALSLCRGAYQDGIVIDNRLPAFAHNGNVEPTRTIVPAALSTRGGL